nr:hypothetical protein GCM10025730_41610 [Promicromonospora thailandica]
MWRETGARMSDAPVTLVATSRPVRNRTGGGLFPEDESRIAVPVPEPARGLRVALLGCGVVGTEVARMLLEQGTDLAARAGARWSSPVSPCATRADRATLPSRAPS